MRQCSPHHTPAIVNHHHQGPLNRTTDMATWCTYCRTTPPHPEGLKMRRERKGSKAQVLPPPSPHPPALVAVVPQQRRVMVRRLSERREEGSRRRRGEGRLWQPFCKAAWKQAEIQAAAVRLQCHRWLPVISLHSGHHPPTPPHPILPPTSFDTPSVFKHSVYARVCVHMCACVCVHSPTRSRSLSLCEAPVIVGGLLL